MRAEHTPVVSVVIPCYNAKATIAETLGALEAQELPEPYEVIVVDSSDDGTDAIIRERFPGVELVRLDRQTLPGSGRNLGVRRATGEIIAFTDADCVPGPDWLALLVQRHRELTTDGVGGSVVNGYPGSVTAWISHLIEFNEWTETTAAGFQPNIPSCNLSFKRAVFDRRGLYFTDVFPAEDLLFTWALAQEGGRLYFEPAARVVHLSRMGLGRLLRHQKRLGMASAEARRRTGMPGHLFVRYPVLSILLPPVRWLRASLRLLRKDLPKALLFWLLTPLYLLAATAWTVGFLSRGSYDEPRYFPESPPGEL